MKNADLVQLRHMLDAAQEAAEFTRGCKRQDLNTDRKLVLALVKEIEIIAEAAHRVSHTTREQIPDIPWDCVMGARHRPVIAYASVNLDILWETLQSELPPLIAELERIVHPGKAGGGRIQ